MRKVGSNDFRAVLDVVVEAAESGLDFSMHVTKKGNLYIEGPDEEGLTDMLRSRLGTGVTVVAS